MNILKIILIFWFLVSCSSGDQYSDLECAKKPNLGRYERQHADIVLEYFDLLTDSTYLYYYQDGLTCDSCLGFYQFINEKDRENRSCQIVFDSFKFIDGHLQNSIFIEEGADFGKLYSYYGVKADSSIIFSNPDEFFDQFVMKK